MGPAPSIHARLAPSTHDSAGLADPAARVAFSRSTTWLDAERYDDTVRAVKVYPTLRGKSDLGQQVNDDLEEALRLMSSASAKPSAVLLRMFRESDQRQSKPSRRTRYAEQGERRWKANPHRGVSSLSPFARIDHDSTAGSPRAVPAWAVGTRVESIRAQPRPRAQRLATVGAQHAHLDRLDPSSHRLSSGSSISSTKGKGRPRRNDPLATSRAGRRRSVAPSFRSTEPGLTSREQSAA